MDTLHFFDEIFEIERKIRTGRPDAQLNALSSIPNCMATVSPLAVGTLYLRIVDFFVASQNETRLAIVNTIRQCQKYSKNIGAHSEEIVRRLGVIWESNDGRARVLVLRMFGYMANGLATVPEAIYRVQQSLNSLMEDEYEAALMSSLEISLVSPVFVVEIIADSLISLYNRIGPYSFLRPKILQILGLRTDNWQLERWIFFEIVRSSEKIFIEQRLLSLFNIASRCQSLRQSFEELLPPGHDLRSKLQE